MPVVEMDNVVALILAGGEGQRLSILAEERAKPAVPFAGKYRIIDFTLSNCVNSGISRVGVLTQYRPQSLTDHVGLGRPWDLDRRPKGLSLLQPYRGRHSGEWYKGTADAVYQHLPFVEESRAQEVLILAGDHVYRQRYDQMVAFHRAKGAEVTVAVLEVPMDDASRFGLVALNEDEAIVEFEEKPAHPRSCLASMGIYLFSSPVLTEVLGEDARRRGSSHDFGRDILPSLVGRRRLFGYRFSGYWKDVGTVDAYWQANMDFLEDPPPLDLDSGEERIRTRPQDRPPARIGPRGMVQRSLLCHGCIIEGTVRNSVLFQGVVVEEGATVQDAILLDDVVVRRGALVDRSILDKEAVVGEGAVVGHGNDNTPNLDEPESLRSGITLVGKGASVPTEARIGRNCKVMPGVAERDYPPERVVPSGATVHRRGRRFAGASVPAA
jgi:glucose-1-phosphate adenylyltransferase